MSDHKFVTLKIPTEIYSRIVGYFRPVQNWNPGKRQEFSERRCYDISFMESPQKQKDSSVA